MNINLMIRILEILEETYYADMRILRLKKLLKLYEEKDFNQVMEYLRETKKINVKTEKGAHVRGRINRPLYNNERAKITISGINYLKDIRLLASREKMNKIMKNATIVIAFAAVISLIISVLNYLKPY